MFSKLFRRAKGQPSDLRSEKWEMDKLRSVAKNVFVGFGLRPAEIVPRVYNGSLARSLH